MAEMKKLVDEVVDLLSWSSSCEAPPRGSWVSIVIIINHIMRSTYWLYIYTQSPRMGSWVGWDMPLVTGGTGLVAQAGGGTELKNPAVTVQEQSSLRSAGTCPWQMLRWRGGDRPGRPGGWWDTVEWGGQEQSATVTPPAGAVRHGDATRWRVGPAGRWVFLGPFLEKKMISRSVLVKKIVFFCQTWGQTGLQKY